MASLSEDLTSKFDKQEDCDAAFVVEGKCIKAHKLILSVRSEVLSDLSKGWSHDLDPITIDTIDFKPFKMLLRYLYSGEIELSKDNEFTFLAAAIHFKVNYLEKKCVDHIETSMNTKNVCQFMNEAINFRSISLQESCCKLFKKDSKAIGLGSSFRNLSQPALSSFLEVDELNIIEIALFWCVKEWMRAKCREQNMEISGENMRQVIGDALFKIRFPTMTVQDFANSVTTIDGLLTDSEIKQIFQKIAIFDNKDVECPFPSEFRCRNNSTYSPLNDMKLLLKTEVLMEVTGIHYFDAISLAGHIKNLETGMKMYPPSFRLLLQCCADMTNSCSVASVTNQTNYHSRKVLHEKMLNWEATTSSDPDNVREYMTAFMNVRSELNKLTWW